MKYRIIIALLLLGATWIGGKLPVEGFCHFDENGNRVEDWSQIIKGSTRFIADENWYYYDQESVDGMMLPRMEIYSNVGKYLEPFCRNFPVNVAIPGAMNMEAYYANFSVAIDEYGLTDFGIAHSIRNQPGHIGHEKQATKDYLFQRLVDFKLGEVVAKLPERLHSNEIAFEIPEEGLWQIARIVTYDKEKMKELLRRFKAAGNNTVIPLYEEMIPNYIKHDLPVRSLGILETDYAAFCQMYFRRYPDTALERPFEERIAELKIDSASRK